MYHLPACPASFLPAYAKVGAVTTHHSQTQQQPTHPNLLQGHLLVSSQRTTCNHQAGDQHTHQLQPGHDPWAGQAGAITLRGHSLTQAELLTRILFTYTRTRRPRATGNPQAAVVVQLPAGTQSAHQASRQGLLITQPPLILVAGSHDQGPAST